MEDQIRGKELVGTAADATKVLSSGKVLRKPLPDPAKQKWIQWRQSRYSRDKRGHIIEALKDQEADELKGKNKEEKVVTKNKFDAVEVEEIKQPALTITDGKENSNDKVKEKMRPEKESQKAKKKKQLENTQISRSYPKKNRSNNVTVLKQGEEEDRRIKKEVVLQVVNGEKKKANKEDSLNPNSTVRASPREKENQNANKEKLPNTNDTRIDEESARNEENQEGGIGRSLWSDDVDNTEVRIGANISPTTKQKISNMQEQLSGTVDTGATVNPSVLKPRLEGSLSSRKQQSIHLARDDK
ncbi:hypothetical protein A4A49_05763 [Nicotiana attenuata]|uniref:Uncharacterized protein n=1 Tax=Nicotiana attenuata TaxID=49451 RepID=A0A314LCY6_NICAT|nr:hypothetical protein A4A49_05763 [Nicotiana attenuata]